MFLRHGGRAGLETRLGDTTSPAMEDVLGCRSRVETVMQKLVHTNAKHTCSPSQQVATYSRRVVYGVLVEFLVVDLPFSETPIIR